MRDFLYQLLLWSGIAIAALAADVVPEGFGLEFWMFIVGLSVAVAGLELRIEARVRRERKESRR